MLDIIVKNSGDNPGVHVQSFGPGDGSIHIINAELEAMLAAKVVQQ